MLSKRPHMAYGDRLVTPPQLSNPPQVPRTSVTAVRGAEAWHRDPIVSRCTVHAALIVGIRGGQDHPLNPDIPLRQQVIDVPVQSHHTTNMAEHPCAQAARGPAGVDMHALGEMDHAQGPNTHFHGPTQLDP